MKALIQAHLDGHIQSKRIPLFKPYRWVAAAAVSLFAIATTFFIVNNKEKAPAVIAKLDVKAPQTNRAMITRANGETVYLDSVANGKLLSLGNVTLEKLADGQIAYSGNTGKVEVNTITNPKGSKVIDMMLTDGTHVWLNAGSSLTYTVPLIKRDVTVTGEAYFEVAHDVTKPFTVTKGDAKVTVLGTHFNVKAFDNDADIKVTLLEGSVRVNKGKTGKLLKPGEQAVIETNSIGLVEHADIEEAVAWRNGYIHFYSTDLNTILHEIERWYDIEIDNTAPASRYDDVDFYVNVKRAAPLKDVLQVFTDSKVKYSFDAASKKLTILP